MVKVKRLHEDAAIPKYVKPGYSGFDLVAVAGVIIELGETAASVVQVMETERTVFPKQLEFDFEKGDVK